MPILKDIPTKYSSQSEPVLAKYHAITRAIWNAKSHSVVIVTEGYASAPVENEVIEAMMELQFNFPVPVGSSLTSQLLEQLLLTTETFLGGTIV